MLNGTNPNNPKYQLRINRDPSFDWENRLRCLAELASQSEAEPGAQATRSKARVYSADRTICRISRNAKRSSR